MVQTELFDGFSMEYNKIVLRKFVECFREVQIRQNDVVKFIFLMSMMLLKFDSLVDVKQKLLKLLQIEQNSESVQRLLEYVELIRYCLGFGSEG